MKIYTIEQLHAQFKEESGIDVINSDGEFDLDYVLWLQKKLVGFENVYDKNGHCNACGSVKPF